MSDQHDDRRSTAKAGLFALAEFLTRPQADDQIGAEYTKARLDLYNLPVN